MNGYMRYFISMIMDKEEFSIKNNKAMGKCIIELNGNKGKISVAAQNLKPEVHYKLFIISCDKDEVVGHCLGNFIVDLKGRGELKAEVVANNVGNTGISLDRFQIVALLIPREGQLIIPLIGYRDEVIVGWKNHFVYSDGKKEINKIQEVVKPLEEKIIEENEIEKEGLNEKLGEEISEKKEVFDEKFIESSTKEKEEMSIHEVFMQMAQKFKEEIAELEDSFDSSKVSAQEDNEIKEIDSKNIVINELKYIFENNQRITPFVKQNKQVKWIRISLKELIYLPLETWKYINQPFIVAANQKYKHLILGFIEEEETYILGIPGLYDKKSLPEMDNMGFIQFKCCEDVPPTPNEHGYWIMPL